MLRLFQELLALPAIVFGPVDFWAFFRFASFLRWDDWLFTFMYFRSTARRRFPFQFDLIVINGGTDETFQGTLINLIALEKIDRSPRVASEARVEELRHVRETEC